MVDNKANEPAKAKRSDPAKASPGLPKNTKEDLGSGTIRENF